MRRFVALLLKRSCSYWEALWGRHWRFMQLPVSRRKASLSPQCRGTTFALECTHIPLGHSQHPQEQMSGRMVTVLTWKTTPHQVLWSKWSRTVLGVHTPGLMECDYSVLRFGQGSYYFRPFSSWRWSRAFPSPHRWLRSGRSSEQFAWTWASHSWPRRKHYDTYGEGLAQQGFSLCLVSMWCDEIYWQKVDSECDISSEDSDPPRGTSIMFPS